MPQFTGFWPLKLNFNFYLTPHNKFDLQPFTVRNLISLSPNCQTLNIELNIWQANGKSYSRACNKTCQPINNLFSNIYSHFIIARHKFYDDGKQYEDDTRQANKTGARQTGDVLIEAQWHHNADGDKKDDAQTHRAHRIAPGWKETYQNF